MLKKLSLLVLTMLLAAGCGSPSHPLIPASDSPDPGFVDSARDSVFAPTERVLWGYFEWVIDTRNETFEAIPLRSSQMHLNVSKFIDAAPTKFSFTNFTVDKAASTIGLDVGITHPFPSNPNLAGFDVRGILIGAGSLAPSEDDPSLVMAGPGDTHLANADGWTRWWNPVEFNIGDNIFSYRDGKYGIKHSVGNYNCTLNGYKLFADDLGKNEHPDGLSVQDRAVFSPGQTNWRHYLLWFPQQDDKFIIKYNYAVDVSWENIPDYQPGEPVSIPDDYIPEANQPEPFRIDIETKFNSLYYENETSKGGSLIYEIRIFDWQGYLNVGDVTDEISELKIEAGCLASSVTGTLLDPGSDPQAYAVYEVLISGDELLSNADCDALITVVSANGDYQPSLTGYNGTAPLSSYEIFPFAEISPTAPPPNQAPTAAAEADKTSVMVGETVTFDASDSSDNDGTIISYEWDFDGDGVYGDLYDGGTAVQPQKIFGETGSFDVDLRVTDDDGDSDTLNSPITIQVNEQDNFAPVAIATADKTEVYPDESITFNGTASYDPDGIVVLWQWDFDGDGTYGDAYDAGIPQAPVVHYDEVGQYIVDLKVTDDDSATDTLNDKIAVYVVSPDNEPPVAAADIVTDEIWEESPVEFDASASYDPDGTVEQYLWDFNNDGVYGDSIEGGTPQNPLKSFAAGDQTVGLKVIDNGGKSDILDTPLQFFVNSHVIITLPEDQNYKSANGYEYLALSCYTPEDIPIEYMDIHGPWDFTGIDYLPDPDYLVIFPPDDDEVDDYMTVFPDTTQYFTRYDVIAESVAGYFYMPEEADLLNNLLYVYGHVEREKGDPTGSTVSYVDADGGPIAIQYPWSIFTDEQWDLLFTSGGQPFMELIYSEVGIGEGNATVPFEGVWETRVLLTRSVWEARFSGQTAAQVLMYKWTADDGKQVARLYALNVPDDANFNESTFEITGESRLTVLGAEF